MFQLQCHFAQNKAHERGDYSENDNPLTVWSLRYSLMCSCPVPLPSPRVLQTSHAVVSPTTSQDKIGETAFDVSSDIGPVITAAGGDLPSNFQGTPRRPATFHRGVPPMVALLLSIL